MLFLDIDVHQDFRTNVMSDTLQQSKHRDDP
jgi:hypothetical protein